MKYLFSHYLAALTNIGVFVLQKTACFPLKGMHTSKCPFHVLISSQKPSPQGLKELCVEEFCSVQSSDNKKKGSSGAPHTLNPTLLKGLEKGWCFSSTWRW
jgi:hypothetical protein